MEAIAYIIVAILMLAVAVPLLAAWLAGMFLVWSVLVSVVAFIGSLFGGKTE